MMERFENTLLGAVVQHIWCLLIPTEAALQTVDMGMNIQIILKTHKQHSN